MKNTPIKVSENRAILFLALLAPPFITCRKSSSFPFGWTSTSQSRLLSLCLPRFLASSATLGRCLGLAWSWQFGSQLSFQFRNNLRIGNSLSGFIFTHDLRFFVNRGRKVFLCHLLGHSSLHNCFTKTLVNLCNLSDVRGLFQLSCRHDC